MGAQVDFLSARPALFINKIYVGRVDEVLNLAGPGSHHQRQMRELLRRPHLRWDSMHRFFTWKGSLQRKLELLCQPSQS